METKTKRKYVAPAVLEDLRLEMEAQILAASHVDEPIEEDVEVVTMGQETDGWEHTWE